MFWDYSNYSFFLCKNRYTQIIYVYCLSTYISPPSLPLNVDVINIQIKDPSKMETNDSLESFVFALSLCALAVVRPTPVMYMNDFYPSGLSSVFCSF